MLSVVCCRFSTLLFIIFFFQAEDGIRDPLVTGVQTCALPISVDQLKDVNDQTNVAGVGINIAQRVMSCGDAGHILLSNRVAKDLAQDRHWQPLLHELGEVELKHGEKVGIVNVYSEELGNPEPPQRLRQEQTVSTRSELPSAISRT